MDSKAAILAAKMLTCQYKLFNVNTILTTKTQRKTVTLHWIPGDYVIEGNEK